MAGDGRAARAPTLPAGNAPPPAGSDRPCRRRRLRRARDGNGSPSPERVSRWPEVLAGDVQHRRSAVPQGPRRRSNGMARAGMAATSTACGSRAKAKASSAARSKRPKSRRSTAARSAPISTSRAGSATTSSPTRRGFTPSSVSRGWPRASSMSRARCSCRTRAN